MEVFAADRKELKDSYLALQKRVQIYIKALRTSPDNDKGDLKANERAMNPEMIAADSKGCGMTSCQKLG